MKKIGKPRCAVHCPVELSDVSGVRAGFARLIDPDCIVVQFPTVDAQVLTPGREFDLRAETEPIGPLRVRVQVDSVGPSCDKRGAATISARLTLVALDDVEQRELESRLAAILPVVVVYGLIPPIERPEEEVDVRVIYPLTEDEVLQCCEREEVAVVVLGSGIEPERAQRVLDRVGAELPGIATENLVIGIGAKPDLFQTYIDEDRIFYLSRGNGGGGEVRTLVLAAAERFRGKIDRGIHGTQLSVAVMEFYLRLCTQSDLASAGALLSEAVRTLTAADQSDYLIYERDKNILMSRDRHRERIESVVSGVVGYVARTGESALVERAGEDWRCDIEADGIGGFKSASLMVEPVLETGGQVVGVVTAVRGDHSLPFSRVDAKTIRLLAAWAGPLIGALVLQQQSEALLLEHTRMEFDPTGKFRTEALDSHAHTEADQGSPLIGIPRWLRLSHWLVVGMLVLGIMFMGSVRIDQYAAGPVVIQATNKTVVRSPTGGAVRSVEVQSGTRVRAGDTLVRFFEETGAGATNRREGQVWSPRDGVISEIRVKAGQQVRPDGEIAAIADESAGSGYKVVAFFPASFAPQLHPGLSLIVKLEGFPDSREVVSIERVNTEVVSSQEAMRYTTSGNFPASKDSVVMVTGHLANSSFAAAGRSYYYRDGQTGSTQVKLGSEPLLLNVLPGLKEVLK